MIVERMLTPIRPAVVSGLVAHQRFSPSADEVRKALGDLRRHMEQARICSDLIARVELVLAELLNNIVEHACADVPGGWIVIRTRLARDGLHVTILDNGMPPPFHLLDRGLPEQAPHDDLPLAALPEGGFGWYLIRHLACDLALDSVLACNRLRLRVPLHEADV